MVSGFRVFLGFRGFSGSRVLLGFSDFLVSEFSGFLGCSVFRV